ncbi:hypothetical protein [Thermodesulfovibrio sp.]|uniref:Spy/CpxP family protein refolding chaperone n=1 Tax=Thermodesulfovibrio sp. TaxID=2067987 RepID=UPI0030AEF28C
MKKVILTFLIAVVSFSLLGGSAYAWRGGAGGYGGGCPMYGYSYVDPEKAQRFYNDTSSLRQKQLQLRGELMQLYAQPNPDWKAIEKKHQEMAQIRTEMQKRAQEHGLPYIGNFGRRW